MKTRLSQRTRFVSQAMVMANCQTFKSTIIDLSLTGLFIKTHHHLPVGHKATISLMVPSVTRGSSIHLEGFVVRNTAHGMGFKFKPLDHDSFAFLRTVIANRKRFSSEQLPHFEIPGDEAADGEKLACACIPEEPRLPQADSRIAGGGNIQDDNIVRPLPRSAIVSQSS